MEKIRISNRSLAAMVSGVERFPDTENGGLLLGKIRNNEFDIIEAIEAGESAIHEKGKLFCDVKSMEYMTNIVKGLYEEELKVVGIWHKHNHDYNPPFSIEDNLCHEKICASLNQDILSVLFQKNQDNEYTMRVFRYCLNHQLMEVEFDIEDLTKMISYRVC